jgi:hypothetical protein
MSTDAQDGSLPRSTAPTDLTTSGPTLSTLLRPRQNAIAKQIEEAGRHASPNDASVQDLYKIVWGSRLFVLDGLLNKRKTRGRRSWILSQGWFLTELSLRLKVKGDVWCCKICDDKGILQFFSSQSTSAA